MNPIEQDIWNMVHKRNKNFLVCVIGMPGTGKSYLGLRFCERLDPNFNIKRVVFTAKDFVELTTADLPPGSAIMWDEVGINLDSRAFMSLLNRMISHILQTFRHKNHIVVFTVPHLDLVDSRARGLFNAIIETDHIDKQYHRNYARYHYVQVNNKTGDAYYKRCRGELVNGHREIYNMMTIGLPSPALHKQYEKAHKEFKVQLGKEILGEMTAPKKVKEEKRSLAEMVEEARTRIHELRDGKGKVNKVLIRLKMGVGINAAQDIARALQ